MPSLETLFIEAFSETELLADIRRRTAERNAKLRTRAAYLTEHFPLLRKETLEAAERAMEGRLILTGTGAKPYFVGDPPNWFANPLKDNEYVWALNRMLHWQALLAAYTFTGEARYAQKVIAELEDWIARCPPPPLPTNLEEADIFGRAIPWRCLEAGIRMYESWPWILDHLGQSELLTPSLAAAFAISVHEHAELIEVVCPMRSPGAGGNHYLMECLGLLSVTRMFPGFRNTPRWIQLSMRELGRCADNQLTSQGGHIEGCPHYHNGCAYWFCLSVLLAKEIGQSFPADYKKRIRGMMDYSLQTTRPTGKGVPWGDSASDTIAASAALYNWFTFGDAALIPLLSKLMGPEAFLTMRWHFLWIVPDAHELLRLIHSSAPEGIRPPLLHWEREMKQVAMRTSWERDAMSVFFACRIPVNNAHAHIDPMGFDFCALGRQLVVDPGPFTYREDQDRRDFKSVEWHNSITVNHQSPFEYKGSWRFGPQKPGDITAVFDHDGVLAAEAMQMSFEPVIHRRLVALIDARLLLVLDSFTELAADASVQMYYHFDTTDLRWDQQNKMAMADTTGPRVLLCSAGNVATEVTGTILPGKVSDKFDVSRESRRLCLDNPKGPGSRFFATLVVPFEKADRAPVVTAMSISDDGPGRIYRFDLDGRRNAFRWEDGKFSRV